MDRILSAWKNPANPHRGKPFWCWNGKLGREELLRQLRIFPEMGMGGFFMHSRTGLDTEYLGDEWFDLINACADEAEKLGLEAWLYDEDRWPSGSAGGKATADPRFRMKYLRLSMGDGGPVVWPDEGHFIAAFSAVVDGLNFEDCERVDRGASVRDGRTLLIFSWETMASHSFYNGSAYLDTLDPEATEHFLSVTHDRYREKCGDRIGRSIRGIFTDEPHHGFVMCDTHGQPGPSDTAWLAPWTHKLPEEFRKAFGHDLIGCLPELFLRRAGRRFSRVKWEYMELIQRMFLANWAQPMRERCREIGLILTGHVLHEDSLGAQAVPCGSMMRYYEYLDWPGVDVLGLDNRNYWIVKQMASVARQMERPWLLSELYGCSGWQLGFDGHKRIGDWQALFGINVRCHHLSWYSMAGESKRDYPASIFFQSAWFREYEKVETYFSRMHVLLQAGRPCCDVLVISPVESVWAQIHAGWATWLQANSPEVKALDEIHRNVFTWLAEAQVDFDYGDEDHLARMGSVDASELVLGAMRYRTVVVAGMETMRSSTLGLLGRFQKAGGSVIFAGDPPRLVDAELSPAAAELSRRCLAIPFSRERLVGALREAGGAASELLFDERGVGLFCQVREVSGQRIAVVINPSDSQAFSAVTIRAKSDGPVMSLDCLTGEAYSVTTSQDVCGIAWETSFAPLQERVFAFGPDTPTGLPALSDSNLSASRVIEGPFEYTLDEPNVCVLDFAEFSVDGGLWEERREILRIESELCERLGVPRRAGDMVQPWAEQSVSSAPGTPLRVRHGFEVDSLPGGPVTLLMEKPETCSITINGKRIDVPDKTEWFIDPCFRKIPLPVEILRKGPNEIVLELVFREGVDLEAVYLLGDFGVALTGSLATLVKIPARLAAGDVTSQGFPFYSGRISYRIPSGRLGRLGLDVMGAAAVTFRHPSGSPDHCVPWKPFVCDLEGLADENGDILAELILTRRNTFGPLHLVPVRQDWIGPESFRSQGRDWADEYQVVPTGLASAPKLFRTAAPNLEVQPNKP